MKQFYLFSAGMLLVMICCIRPSQAQSNFVPGYVIRNTGDTLRGMIDFQDWETNPEKIMMLTDDGETRVWFPKDIRSFFVPPDNRFVSMKASMDCTPYTWTDVTMGKTGRVVSDTMIYLRELVRGKMSLYYLMDVTGKPHFYVLKPDIGPVELIVKKSLGVNDQPGNYSTYVATVNVFRGQMKVLMEDCPGTGDAANITDYTESSLKRLVRSYDRKCGNGDESVFMAADAKVGYRFGPVAGVYLVSMNFHGKETNTINEAKFPATPSYTLGGFFRIIIPRNLSRLSFDNEIIYKPYSITSNAVTETTILQPWIKKQITYSIDAAYLKLNTLGRYSFLPGKVNLFVDAGISNAYAINIDATQSVVTYEHGNITSESQEPIFDGPRRYEFGAIAGAGVFIHNFGVELRYEWSTAMSPYNTLTGSVNSFFLLASYNF